MHEFYWENNKQKVVKSTTITKLFDKFRRRVEFWNDCVTVAAPRTIQTTVGREIWSKILVKKLINKCGCFKN